MYKISLIYSREALYVSSPPLNNKTKLVSHTCPPGFFPFSFFTFFPLLPPPQSAARGESPPRYTTDGQLFKIEVKIEVTLRKLKIKVKINGYNDCIIKKDVKKYF